MNSTITTNIAAISNPLINQTMYSIIANYQLDYEFNHDTNSWLNYPFINEWNGLTTDFRQLNFAVQEPGLNDISINRQCRACQPNLGHLASLLGHSHSDTPTENHWELLLKGNYSNRWCFWWSFGRKQRLCELIVNHSTQWKHRIGTIVKGFFSFLISRALACNDVISFVNNDTAN